MNQSNKSDQSGASSATLAITTGDIVSWQWANPSSALAAPAASAHAGDAAKERYRPLHLLGRGGMGEVMLCSDGVIRREVALKRILPSHADDAGTRARFLNEAQIQGQLEHPSIVPVYDLSFSPDGSVFFTMKRLRGRTLEDIIAGLRANRTEELAAFPRYRLLQALASVCQAIGFAHGRGVIHRDLKPANIMLGDFGEVYVLDWGLAKLQSHAEQAADIVKPDAGMELAMTAQGMVNGTIAYMSPEQAGGANRFLDERSDVFTLGVILFELLTLQRLRPEGTPQAMLLGIYEEQSVRPSERAPQRDISPELDEICLRATQKDQAARYGSAAAMHAAIVRYLAGERDLALRQELAKKYVTAASAAAERALTGEPDAVAARRTALSDVGRALALDPTDSRAWSLLHQLLTVPPHKLPSEVEAQVQHHLAERERLSLGALLFTGTAFFFLVPVLFMMGVRDRPLMTALVFTGIVSLTLRWRISQPEVSTVWRYLAQLSSLALYFCIGRIFGPLILMPIPLMIHATLNSLSAHAGHRHFSLVTSCGLLVGMVMLEQLGYLSHSFLSASGGLLIAPNLAYLPLGLTQVLLVGMGLLTIILCSLSLGRIPNRLLAAERQQALHAWQMRLLLDENIAPHAR